MNRYNSYTILWKWARTLLDIFCTKTEKKPIAMQYKFLILGGFRTSSYVNVCLHFYEKMLHYKTSYGSWTCWWWNVMERSKLDVFWTILACSPETDHKSNIWLHQLNQAFFIGWETPLSSGSATFPALIIVITSELCFKTQKQMRYNINKLVIAIIL